MNKFTGTILTIPKMSGNVGAKTINIGGKGDDGATFIPSVSDSGIISWTNDKDLPNPEPVNIKGKDGKDGKDGVNGKDGADGKDGYTPQKGIDYFDGQPGKDGVDGAPGTPGVDGITPHIGSNGNWYIGDTDTGKPSRGASGQPGQNGSPGADGIPGKDGVSATHSWNGTVLTITSASGTSSANLKGEKGDQGIQGVQGEKGETGSAGKDGTSVTVKSVSESTADGGSNVVTFSDGKTLTVKNGSKGSTGAKGADGYTPQKNVDYFDGKDGKDGKDGLDATPVTPLFVNTIEECTDTTKPYVLPDGYIYAYLYTDTDPEPLYTNRLPEAINEDKTPFVGANGEKGYKDGYRITGSGGTSGGETGGGEKAQSGYQVTGFIPVLAGQVVRVKNTGNLADASRYCTAYFYNETFAKLSVTTLYFADMTLVDGVYQFTVQTSGYGSSIRYMRLTFVGTSADTIVTVDQEIKISEGGTGYKWANTGHAFVPADYENRILEVEADVTKHDNQIANLEKKVENINADASLTAAYDRIKRWKYPIYENAPVFLLETNKAALSGSFENTNAVYAKYDALMSAHSHYITRENCGMASDGTTPIYVYHFAEPEPHKQTTGIYLETKPVILVCSGVHPREIAGVYCMYYAMEEITTNPKLLDLRRNLHFVIMPMINPTAFSDTEYYMRNPDGIQVHYNFEVDHGANGAVHGDRNYGGASPLSIPETQYFDALMAEYKDTLACVISCHNNEVDEKYGTGFIWCSCATDYMVNLGNRFVDKMSVAWLGKHGNAFTEGIRWANDYAIANAGTGMFFDTVVEQPDWDYRVGRSSISGSGGTEYKQGIKYGVHGANVEVCPRCLVLDRDYTQKYTQNVMTMGAETYINYFRTFMAAYATVEKDDYAPNLPWSE